MQKREVVYATEERKKKFRVKYQYSPPYVFTPFHFIKLYFFFFLFVCVYNEERMKHSRGCFLTQRQVARDFLVPKRIGQFEFSRCTVFIYRVRKHERNESKEHRALKISNWQWNPLNGKLKRPFNQSETCF